MFRTIFLKKRQYMTTLEPRWEKPDYTGVVAKVPLGHAPHLKNQPKKSQFELCLAKMNDLVWFPLKAMRPASWKLPTLSQQFLPSSHCFLARLFLGGLLPVSGTCQIQKLASFLR